MEKPRKLWHAALLSLLQPGLGHVYCGTWKGGIQFYVLSKVVGGLGLALLFWLPFPKVNIVFFIICLVGMYGFILRKTVTLAKQEGDSYILRPYNKWYFYLIILIAVWAGDSLVIAPLTKTIIGKSYKIPAASMIPTLLIGDHILSDKMSFRFQEPQRGDIITFPYPEDESKTFIKRIIGLPGETIEIVNKVVMINDMPLDDEAYTQRIDPGTIDGRISPRDNYGPEILPADSYFVMGDSRDQSLDSRFWGFVPRKKIEGKVNVIYWSWDSDEMLDEWVRWDRVGQRIP